MKINKDSILVIAFVFLLIVSTSSKKSKIELDNDLSFDEESTFNKASASKYKRLSNSMNLTDKQNRLKTCSNIVQNFASKTYDRIIQLAGFIDPTSESERSVKHAMSLFLMSCYKNLPLENNEIENKLIDDSFFKYLEFDSWYDVYMSSQQEIIRDSIKQYELVLNDMSIAEKSLNKEKNKSDSNNKKNDDDEYDDDYYNERNKNTEYDIPPTPTKKEDLELFGINLTKLPESTKLIAGLSLLFSLLIGFAIVARKAINELPQNKQKVSTKKRKD